MPNEVSVPYSLQKWHEWQVGKEHSAGFISKLDFSKLRSNLCTTSGEGCVSEVMKESIKQITPGTGSAIGNIPEQPNF